MLTPQQFTADRSLIRVTPESVQSTILTEIQVVSHGQKISYNRASYESTPMHRNGGYLIDDYAIPNLFTTDKARFAESLYYTEIDPCYLFCYVYNGLWKAKDVPVHTDKVKWGMQQRMDRLFGGSLIRNTSFAPKGRTNHRSTL